MRKIGIAVTAGLAVTAGAAWFLETGISQAQGIRTNPALDMTLASSFDVPAADAQTIAIVAAANAFIATLDDAQKAEVMFALDDNAQRVNWSNFPHPVVARQGVMRADMTAEQLAALDALLSTVMSESGKRNIDLQLAADEASDTGGSNPLFGEEYYFISFLGEPAVDAPWMLQFGGHHLAINVTVFGPDLSFAPMLTGGEPLNLTYEGEQVFITENEVTAAQALIESLDDAQLDQAVRSSKMINLVLGPGEDNNLALPPEGIAASALDDTQKALLVDLIATRLGFINDDDFDAKMADVIAGLDDTYFGWWGPTDAPGAAYFRVTGPSLIIEYAPQNQGNSDDHAHNMYRDPQNDYGRAWLAQ